MCIIKITKYASCPASHSESVVLYQHANAIYCAEQEVLEDNRAGKCPACREKEEAERLEKEGKDRGGDNDDGNKGQGESQTGERRDSAVDVS